MEALYAVTLALGLVILVFGGVKLVYVPLALIFEVDQDVQRRGVAQGVARHRRRTLLAEQPLVSVVVPGYNEGPVIENCVHSILASDYPHLEVILVDDGSTDNTPQLMAALADQYQDVRFIRQANAGKGAALNTGARQTSGEILMFVDSDGIFLPNTVTEMLLGFTDAKVGAVCGDDRPVNLDRVQTRFLNVISHVGTGLVRRALHVLRCLPIVSGNIGAFRREALEKSGLLREDTLGEDLELTWRIHQAGYRVNFAPRALVYAESPSTIRGLWKQRVRWARGLLQCVRLHWKLIGNPRHGMFGVFLAFTVVTGVMIPVLQLTLLVLLPVTFATGGNQFTAPIWDLLLWLGLPIALGLSVFAMALNRALGDLRHAWTTPLWPVYSVMMSVTLVAALISELRGQPARWNKLERTGVVSVGEARESAGKETP